MAEQGPATFRRLAKALCLPFVLCAAFLSQPVLSQTPETDGYRYTLHEARPDSLEVSPAALDPVERYVAQGQESTLIWTSGVEPTLDHASIAGGQKQMGLLIPYWDPDLSPADDSGWSMYGRPISYKSFDMSVERGKNDHDVDGQPASHYVMKASLVIGAEGDPVSIHEELTSDVWIAADKPFSYAPFNNDSIYGGDPRLGAAISEALSELGMVLRLETSHFSQIREDGVAAKEGRESAHIAWVTDLRAAKVPDVNVPLGSEQLLSDLRSASRENPEETCAAAINGELPGFVREMLDASAQEPFMKALKKSCERRR